ncbi:hypothetical protein SprV_0301053600 [Sparganum proliferum]
MLFLCISPVPDAVSVSTLVYYPSVEPPCFPRTRDQAPVTPASFIERKVGGLPPSPLPPSHQPPANAFAVIEPKMICPHSPYSLLFFPPFPSVGSDLLCLFSVSQHLRRKATTRWGDAHFRDFCAGPSVTKTLPQARLSSPGTPNKTPADGAVVEGARGGGACICTTLPPPQLSHTTATGGQ